MSSVVFILRVYRNSVLAAKQSGPGNSQRGGSVSRVKYAKVCGKWDGLATEIVELSLSL